MATVFMQKIVERVYESPAQATLQAKAAQIAQTRFDTAVEAMRQDFEENPVTQEIKAGPGTKNLSETLIGGESTAYKDLSSFIGFPAGSDPLKPIEERLEPSNGDGPKLTRVGKELRGTAIRYQFKASGPDEEAIWQATPIPWTDGDGFSWAEKIETHIPGFASFLNGPDYPQSKSGGGIQAKVGGKPNGAPQVLRDADYRPPAKGYLQTIFKAFLERLRKFQ